MENIRKVWEENQIQCSLKVFQNYVHKHGLENAIEHFKTEYKQQVKRDKPLTAYWKESGLDCTYDKFKYEVRVNPDLTIEQIIEKLKQPKEKTAKQIYDEANISDICTYGAFKRFRLTHPKLTIDQVIEYYKTEYKQINKVKREKSLKEIHAESGLICSYQTFKAYVSSNKDKTIEEVIKYLKENYIPRKEIVENSLSKIWRDNKLNCNINYFIKYVKEHPEEDINNIVEKFKQDKNISLASICKREKIDIHSIRGYMKRYNITVDEAIEMYRSKEKEDKERAEFKRLCEENSINAYNAWIYKNKHPGITNEEIIEHYKTESIASKCKRLGLSYSAVMGYKKEHTELDYDTIIEKYLQPKELYFTEKCRIAGVHGSSAASYRRAHPELTDEEVIKHFINNKKYMDICEKYGIDTRKLLQYKRWHKEITEEELILYFRPDLCINSFGEIVEI